MSDKINSVIQNIDGSYDFNFTLDNGAGILGNIGLHLPAGDTPYTLETAKAAILPIAAAQKAAWIAEIGSLSVVGNVIL